MMQTNQTRQVLGSVAMSESRPLTARDRRRVDRDHPISREGRLRAQKKAGRRIRPAEGLPGAESQFRKETAAGDGPPSGHPRLLKPSSWLALLRIVVLSQ